MVPTAGGERVTWCTARVRECAQLHTKGSPRRLIYRDFPRNSAGSAYARAPAGLAFILGRPQMRCADVIAHKRDGQSLTRDEIDLFFRGVVDGSVPDYQASALLMAIVLRGMDDQETWFLTDAMTRSGGRVDLSDLPGI